jgi:hypothetical protein
MIMAYQFVPLHGWLCLLIVSLGMQGAGAMTIRDIGRGLYRSGA